MWLKKYCLCIELLGKLLDNVLDVAEKVLPKHRVVGKVIKKILSVNILRVISIF